MSISVPKLGTLQILGCFYLLSGCSTYVDYAIGIPPRPILIPLTAEMQAEISPDTLDILAANDLELKHALLRCEGRIRIHDKALE